MPNKPAEQRGMPVPRRPLPDGGAPVPARPVPASPVSPKNPAPKK